MAYAYDIMHGEDWGNGPVFDSDYDYPSPIAALDAALDVIDQYGWREDDTLSELTGVYVVGENPADDGSESETWIWAPHIRCVDLMGIAGGAEDING